METPAPTITPKMVRTVKSPRARQAIAVRFFEKAEETLTEYRYHRRNAILAKENEHAARKLGATSDALMAHDVAKSANEMAAAWLEWYNAYICAYEAITLDGLSIEDALRRATREFQSGDAAEWSTEVNMLLKE